MEFSNKLLLCEQLQGLIVAFRRFQKGSPADKNLVPKVIDYLHNNFLRFLPDAFKVALVGDRGFDDPQIRKLLEDIGWFNGIAARDP